MATAKNTTSKSKNATAKSQPSVVKPVTFSKQQILTFERYAKRRDLLSVLLKDDKSYTSDQVDSLIEEFMKGKVK